MAEVEAVPSTDFQNVAGEPVQELRAPRCQPKSLRLLALTRVEPRAQRVIDLTTFGALDREAGTSAARAAIGARGVERHAIAVSLRS